MNSLFQGTYDDFELSPELQAGLVDLGYSHPTSVQSEVFDPIFERSDLVVQSQTGSGKTAAFCLPILKQLESSQKSHPQVLVLAPTRELAKQVATECGRLAHKTNTKVCSIYGGASYDSQIANLKAGAQFVVGTPGRLKDLNEREELDLSKIEVVVLDEADEMLSMGFWEDVTHLIAKTPKERQTLLFSATLPWAIEKSLVQITRDHQLINLSSDQVAAQTIRHVAHVEENPAQTKSRSLLYALELHKPTAAIVFCNTKEETGVLENYLQRFSFKAQALNGDMSQNVRERVMQGIKSREIDILIATDVAARGIDIPGLSHVFNYDLPDNPEVYVHRTGRTGRIGHLGTAVSLIRGADIIELDQVEKTYEIPFEKINFPAESEILWMQGERLATLLTEQAEGVETSQYHPIAESMLKRDDAIELLAYLLRSHFAKKPVATESSKPARERSKPKRQAREPREPREQKQPDYQDLYVTLGRSDGFEELSQLAQHVSELSGVDFGHFTGSGNLRDTSSHLEVDHEVADTVKEKIHGLERPSGVTETITCDFGTGKATARQQRPRPHQRRQNHRRPHSRHKQ